MTVLGEAAAHPHAEGFTSVLIANRGEIARRVIRSARAMGLRTIAVYSEADRAAMHVRDADEAYLLGPAAPEASYLNIARILEVAAESGAGAIHPGYGFLSENVDFVRAVEDAGIMFIGPTAEQVEMFGPKHTARAIAESAGVPCVPGTGVLHSVESALGEAERIGYPVMLKASGGGGGVGIVTCSTANDLRDAFGSVSRLAKANFGSPEVFLEKFVQRARHLEVQVFGDGAGNVLILGDRDCSLQRRNQKVLEEAPAPALDDALRTAMHRYAFALAASVSYRSAGTVEFIYDVDADAVYFLEMNTRLQVEHPVTEQIFEIDLVEWMLKVGLGDVGQNGFLSRVRPRENDRHSLEARIYAEDPGKDFQPSSGLLTEVSFPAEGAPALTDIRIETGVRTGDEVAPIYDPMLAKLIVTADTRHAAFDLLARALSETRFAGVETNIGLLDAICRAPEPRDATMTTSTLSHLGDARPRIDVVRGGPSTTIQDWPGRVGYWQVGISPGGPMDDLSFRMANRAVGNHEGSPALEATVGGPSLRFSAATRVAVTGAPASVTVDGRPVEMWAPIEVPAGGVLDVGTVRGVGVRTYVAVQSGFDVPNYLGSAATFEAGRFGGHGGRPIATGDVLRAAERDPQTNAREIPEHERPTFTDSWILTVSEGPQPAPEYFLTEDMDAVYAATWRVHFHAARTGIRLIGPKPRWARANGGEAGLHPSNLHDNAYSVGAVNFTGDTPSILGPDGPSLGGFACPITVVSADRWKLGQLRPGDAVRFVPVQEKTFATVVSARTAGTVLATQPSARDADNGVMTAIAATTTTPQVVYRRGGDDNVLVEYGPMILDFGLRLRIHVLMEAVNMRSLPGLLDLTPGVRSLHLHVDPAVLSIRALLEVLLEIEDALPASGDIVVPSREVNLPLAWNDPTVGEAIDRYRTLIRDDAPWNPSNIEFIRRANGLSDTDEVRRIVMSAEYMVLGLGDVYLGAPAAAPVDPRHRLLTTKYNPARTWTAEGTVGIGGQYMCIYGMDSPGGYQLVGRTIPIWAGLRERSHSFRDGSPWLLRFFDRVKYHEVSHEELTHLRSEMAADRLELEITQGEFSLRQHEQFLADNHDDIVAFRTRQADAFERERIAWEQAGEFTQKQEEEETESITDDIYARVPEGGVVIDAPMAGAVWKTVATAGDALSANDPIVILEAMKMETPVRADKPVHVVELFVSEGAIVAAGQPIAVVTPLAVASSPDADINAKEIA